MKRRVEFAIGWLFFTSCYVSALSIGFAQGSLQPSPIYQVVVPLTGEAVTGASWGPDGTSILVNATQSVWLYTNELESITSVEGVRSAVFNPQGQTFAAVETVNNNVNIYDIATSEIIETLRIQKTAVGAIAFDPPGNSLAGTSSEGIWIWDLGNDSVLTTFQISAPPPYFIAWSPDGHRLAVSGDDFVEIWNVENSQLTTSLNVIGSGDNTQNRLYQAVWNADGTHIATAALFTPFSSSETNPLKIWNSSNGELQLVIQTGLVNSIAWNADDGMTLATGVIQYTDSSVYAVRFWNSLTGEWLRSLWNIHASFIHSVSWNPDGDRLLTASEDNVVKIWEWLQNNLGES
jgi:WD40 repeat protein